MSKIQNTIQAIYPANSLQQGFIYHALSQEQDDAYRVQSLLDYHNAMDVEYYKQAWELAILSYPILRASFNWDEEIIQIIYRKGNLNFTYYDLSKEVLSEVQRDEKIRQIQQGDRRQGFDLRKPTQLRLCFIKHSEVHYTLLRTFHHSIVDGWSGPLLLNKVHEFYQQLQGGIRPSIKEDHSYLQAQKYYQEHQAEVNDYWYKQIQMVKQTNDLNALLSSKVDLDDIKTVSQAKEEMLKIDGELYGKLKQLSKRQGITINTIVQFVWHKLIQSYTGDTQTIVGTTVSGRNIPIDGIEDSVGLYINTLPLIIDWKKQADTTIAGQLTYIYQRITELNNYSYANLAALQRQGRRLFHSLIVFENYPMPEDVGKEDGSEKFKLKFRGSIEKLNYPLAIVAYEYNQSLTIGIKYAGECISRDNVIRLLSQLKLIFQQTLDVNSKVASISLITQEEYEQIVYKWNNTGIAYPQDKTICQLFEEQVNKTPNNIAIMFEDRRLTYSELNEKSNQLARYIKGRYKKRTGLDLKPDTLIALCMDRSYEMVMAMLAILKAGGAYVPIGHDYPKERIRHILKDTGTNIVITQKNLQSQLEACIKESQQTLENKQVQLVVVDGDQVGQELKQSSKSNLKKISEAINLAYVIYTSGTSGSPKGVLVENRSVVNYVKSLIADNKLNDKSVGSQYAGFSFDATVIETYPILLSGGTLCIIKDKDRLVIEKINDFFNENHITYAFLPTKIAELFFKLKNNSLINLIVGGEKLGEITNQAYRIVNAYGPTEATVQSTRFVVDNQYNNIPIGKPINNVTCYVVDNNLGILPIGAVGQLMIGGEGLARGYLNHPELTAKKFIANPFQTAEEKTQNKNGRLYKTGDLVRWLPDGNIEYIGRNDFQVKIRGYRIELGEIESVLSKVKGIKQVTVQAKGKQTEAGIGKYLAAYYIKEPEASITQGEIINYLSKVLPDYMVPNVYVELENFPLTANGKLDGKALPEPEFANKESYVAPTNELEQKLCGIWQKLLKLERIGIEDNFFAVGGDSIISIQLISRARQAGMQLTAKDIFKHPTIKQLAQVTKQAANQQEIKLSKPIGEVMLTPVQAWFFEQNNPDTNYFNQASTFVAKDHLDVKILQQAVDAVIERHDAFRLRYKLQNNVWKQWYSENAEAYKVTVEEIFVTAGNGLSFSQQLVKHCDHLQSHLNIETGPIIRVALISGNPDQKQRLFITVHHLVIDGISWRILCEDLQNAYRRLQKGKDVQLPMKTSSYKSWADALKAYGDDTNREVEWQYWLETVSNVPSLPTDESLPCIYNSDFEAVVCALSEFETEKLLHKVANAYNTQINDILLSGLSLALYNWNNITDILIHLEGHGREECVGAIDISETIGWFTSIFPVRLQTNFQHLGQHIKSIKEMLRNIPNKGIGYGILRYMTQDSRIQDLAKGDNAQISFNYLGNFSSEEGDDALLPAKGILQAIGSSVSMRNKASHVLNINGVIHEGQLKIYLAYSKKHFHQARIEVLGKCYKDGLSAIIEHCSTAKTTQYTPSDFPLAELRQDFLDTIDNTKIEDIYGLAPLQKGMLFHALYSPQADLYHTQINYIFKGIKVDIFKKAWEMLFAKCAIFRTGFIAQDYQEPLQIVYKKVELKWVYQDWRHLSAEAQKETVDTYLEQQRKKVLDFGSGNLSRFDLIQLNDEKILFSWTHHHILLDGWSLSIVMSSLLHIYFELENNASSSITLPAYKDYIFWLRQQKQDDAKSFWKKQLLGFVEPTALNINNYPIDIHKPIERLTQVDLNLAEKLSQQIEVFAKKHHVTSNIVFQLAWAKLLSVYSGQKDIVFGVTISGRPAELSDVEKIVGLFINTLPLRVKCDGGKTIGEQLIELQQLMQDINNHGYLSLMEIQNLTEINAGQALFHSLFVFENYPVEKLAKEISPTIDVRSYNSHEKTNYPISIIIVPGKRFSIRVAYDADNFRGQSMLSLTEHFQQALENIVLAADKQLADVDLLIVREKKQLLEFVQETPSLEYPNLIRWLESQVARNKERIAIECNGEELSYRELNCRANQLAHYLRSRYMDKYLKPMSLGVLIGLCVERNLNIVIGILAILKAGGTYVPLDPSNPGERLAFILQDAHIPMVVTQDKVLAITPHLSSLPLDIVSIDKEMHSIASQSRSNLDLEIPAANPCYVIYTSGTTGNPKGVVVTHKNVVRLFAITNNDYTFNKNDVWTLFHSYAFDFSVWEIWGAFLYGGKVIVVPREVARNSKSYWDLLKTCRVTVLNQTPSAFKQLSLIDAECAEKLESLRYVIFGGESLTKSHIDLWVRKYGLDKPKLINMYGITEITVHGTYHAVQEADILQFQNNISIGQRLQDLSFYVLNNEIQLVPVGVPGELYIGGAGVAAGYLNREKLTSKRFIENPFLHTEDRRIKKSKDEETRIYKTGDLVKWLPNGNLEYVGRSDDQVKIRGFRIELGEIESQIKSYTGIDDVIVLVKRDNSGDNFLCAFLEAVNFLDSNIADLILYLKGKLPAYMIPVDFVILKKIPLNHNGKVDKKILLAPSGTVQTKESATNVVVQNNLEKKIMDIFAKLLGRKNIEVCKNFFDIGVHSLMVVQATRILNKELEIKLEPVDLFTYTSIRKLADYISAFLNVQNDSVKVEHDALFESCTDKNSDQAIAVVGLSCRYPQVNSVEDFWGILISGQETIKHFSNEELLNAGMSAEIIGNANYVKARGVLDNIDKFDAKFFNYSPAEAAILDPQHRVFLEEAWAALENAGCVPSKYPGVIGVYAGTAESSYLFSNIMQSSAIGNYDSYQVMIGNSSGTLTTKVSYKLNLTGPSLNISTACSTSLVAIAIACEQLRSKACDVALAGGVSIGVPQETGYLYQEGGIASPDGHCRAFDSKAQGAVSSSGVGVVVLKRLSDALKDHDHIDAVILGVATNNDGAEKIGYTAPSVLGQTSCIKKALLDSKVDAATIGYIETHGTGTPLGDPIEIAALNKAYGEKIREKFLRAIGSVKTNIGHADVAAGVAGFIKTVLSLKHKKLVPSLHFESPNPKVDFKNSPFYVNTTLRDWDASAAYPRRAGVSSFGIGGTNAHVILEEASIVDSDIPKHDLQLLTLSAKTSEALKAQSQNLAAFLDSRSFSSKEFANVAYTLKIGREGFSYRSAMIAASSKEAVSQLKNISHQKTAFKAIDVAQKPCLIFVFSGQGSQYVNMGLELYKKEKVFKQAVDECYEILRLETGFNLMEILYPTKSNKEANIRLQETMYTQPALFVVEYAMSKLLYSWGIEPTIMIGHSLGEYVAIHFSGVLDLADALKLVAKRAMLMSQVEAGSMLSVSLSEEKIKEFLNNDVALAVVNAPELTVLSGKKEAVVEVEQRILQTCSDVKTQKLHTSHAFHSSMMDSISEKFREVLNTFQFKQIQKPFVSNLTGKLFEKGDVLGADYFVKHLCQTVRFSDGLKTLYGNDPKLFLVIGPGASLKSLLQQNMKEVSAFNTLPHAIEIKESQVSESSILLNTLGKLWEHGLPIDWSLVYGEENRQKVALPTYPFEKKRHWITSNSNKTHGVAKMVPNKDLDQCLYEPSWERVALLKNMVTNKYDGKYVIFDNQSEFSQAIIDELRAKFHEVIVVKAGVNFQTLSDLSFTINPASNTDYEKLFDSFSCCSQLNILYLWSMSDFEPKVALVPTIGKQINFEFNSLLLLSQTCCKKIGRETAVKFSVFANNTFKILGHDFVEPRKSLLLGIVRALPLEQQNIKMNFFDVDKDSCADSLSLLPLFKTENDSVFASRFGYLWKEVIVPVKSDKSSTANPLLRKNGVYLITGGLGGIGLALAKYLARNYQANLVLVSRSKFPEKKAWENYLEKCLANDPIAQKIKKLQEILDCGAAVDVQQYDISNSDDTQKIVADCFARYGNIHGVIHAAGLPGGGFIALKKISDAEKVLQPKVQGTMNLVAALHKYPLDFFLMCSALTSLMGVPGQSDYSSANAFLDGVSQAGILHPDTFVLAINWNAWRDAGMAVQPNIGPQEIAGGNNISSPEGQAIFAEALKQKHSQVLISLYDPEVYKTEILNLVSEKAEVEVEVELGENFVDPIENQLTGLFKKLLGVDEVFLDSDFFELGGHSLLALHLISDIEKIFSMKIAVTDIYRLKTFKSLADFIRNPKSNFGKISILVSLKKGNKKPPLFFVHPIGGTIFPYVKLAKQIDNSLPIYAIQDPGLQSEQHFFKTFEELAAHYLSEIKQVQPRGPYFLSGWSYGGSVSFEIAKQLEKEGEAVKFLGMIDSWRKFADVFKDKEYFKSVLAPQGRNTGLIKNDPLNFEKWIELQWHRMELLYKYTPPKINAEITLFKAEELLPEYALVEDTYNHWKKHSSQPIRVYKIPGNHQTIVEPPNICRLSKIVNKLITK